VALTSTPRVLRFTGRARRRSRVAQARVCKTLDAGSIPAAASKFFLFSAHVELAARMARQELANELRDISVSAIPIRQNHRNGQRGERVLAERVLTSNNMTADGSLAVLNGDGVEVGAITWTTEKQKLRWENRWHWTGEVTDVTGRVLMRVEGDPHCGSGTVSDVDGREIGTAQFGGRIKAAVLLFAGGTQIGAMRLASLLKKFEMRISDASGSNVGTFMEQKGNRWALELEQSVSEPLRSTAIAASLCYHGILSPRPSGSSWD
jgi:hypothetical protein